MRTHDTMLEQIATDVRHALRVWAKTPGVAAAAVVTLALGVGLNGALFGCLDAVWFRSLPVREADRVVTLYNRFPSLNLPHARLSPLQIQEHGAKTQLFESVAALLSSSANVTGEGEPERLQVQQVTTGFFDVMGVRPVRGRMFTAADASDPEPKVVISASFWRTRFGQRDDIVGQLLELDERRHEVVGVAPRDFERLYPDVRIWLPFALAPNLLTEKYRWELCCQLVARLHPQVTVEDVRASLAIDAKRYERQFHDFGTSAVPIREEFAGPIEQPIMLLVAAGLVVLAITGVNITNLLLLRAAARTREIAVRTALGASRRRIAAQIAVETLVLAVASGALGIGFTMMAIGIMQQFAPVNLYQLAGVRVDWRVVVATMSIAVLAGAVAALVPALHASRTPIAETLNDGGTRGVGLRAPGRRWRAVLVALQMALAVVLLCTGGLLVRSFINLSDERLGFAATGLGTMRVSLPRTTYRRPETITAFWNATLARVGSLPGVQHAAFAFQPPFTPGGATTLFRVRGHHLSDPQAHADALRVSPDYFTTAGIALRRGRFFVPSEMRPDTIITDGTPIIIDEALENRLQRTGDPLGAAIGRSERGPWGVVVGIVATVKTGDLTREPPGTIYFPAYNREATLLFRTTGDPAAVGRSVRQAIAAVDPSQAVFDVKTMEQRVADSLSGRRYLLVILTVFASLAVILAFIGLYGFVSYAVSQRTTEIGIRLSLGAQARDILALTLWWGVRLAVLGTIVGSLAALLIGRWLRGTLFGVSAHDPLTFATVTVAVVATAVAATYLPCRRAVRTDPASTLAQQ